MKIWRIVLSAGALLFLASDAFAQSARQLTRRVVTPENSPSSVRGTPPASPAPRPTPAPATNAAPRAVPAPPRPADPDKAKAEAVQRTISFERKNAEQGSPWAQYALGVRYLKGDGLEPDETKAREWLEKAAKKGDSRAKKKLEEIGPAKKE